MGREEETICFSWLRFQVDDYWCCGYFSSRTFRFKGIINFPKASKLMMQKKKIQRSTFKLPFPSLMFSDWLRLRRHYKWSYVHSVVFIHINILCS